MGTCSQDYRCWLEAHLFRGGACNGGRKGKRRALVAGVSSEGPPAGARWAAGWTPSWGITGQGFAETEGRLEATLRDEALGGRWCPISYSFKEGVSGLSRSRL